MESLFWILHVVVAIALVGVVLLQPGQSGGMGTAFGGGGSQTLFGSGGSSSFLSRVTAALATIFFLTSLGLAVLSNRGEESLMAPAKEEPATQEKPVPAPTPPSGSEVPTVPGAAPGQRQGGSGG